MVKGTSTIDVEEEKIHHIHTFNVAQRHESQERFQT